MFNVCLYLFICNIIGCMEFGGIFFNKCFNCNNDGGNICKIIDVF